MSRRGASPVLVGRAAEMAALETALETVRQGGPAAVLVGGEAGMGKTRLLGEFTAAARDAGVRVLTGACLELGADGLPYSPFTAMLRELVRDDDADEIATLLPRGGRAARELSRLVPEFAADGHAADTAHGMDGPAVHLPAGEARAQLFEAFLTLLERLAEQRPLCLVVEDAHWADRSSRDLLAFLIGYQRALPNVLIVATFRSDELHRTHPLRPLLAELARIDWVERVELPRLTRGQAEELAAAILGHVPDQTLADSVYQRAEGNPLFTEELLACSDGCDMIPDTLADLLLQAVRRLPEDTQEVLRIASAGSGVTSDTLLAEVTGRGVADLAAAIRPAVAANVLVTSSSGYSFRHALIQEAVHEDLLPGEHAAVHTRFARAIEADPALVSPGRAEIEKAHHWYSAHNTTGALVACWQAAVQASNAIAHAERLMLLDRVLELWDQVPDAATRIGADHVRVLQEAATSARDAAEYQRGLAFTELALSELDQTAEPVRVALLLDERYTFRYDLGLPNPLTDIERALELVPETDDAAAKAARTRLLLTASHCHSGVPEPQFRAWADEALRSARAIGDHVAHAQALSNLAMFQASPGQLAGQGSEALRLLEQAQAVARQASGYHQILMLVILESHLLCGAGEYERAATVARRGIADAERHGMARTSGAFLAINLAEPLFYLGDWDEAARVAGRALDLAPTLRTRLALWEIQGMIALARGDQETAVRLAAACRAALVDRADDDQYNLPQATLELDVTLATKGATAAVTLAAETMGRYNLSRSSPRYTWPLVVSAAIAAHRASAELNMGDHAAGVLDGLRTIAEKLEVFGPVQRAWQLSFAAVAGTAHEADPARQLAAADLAASAWDAIGQPYPAAVALVYAARAALAARATREASVRLHRAAEIAGQLGAAPLADEIAGLMRRAVAEPGTADVGLTSRELEVLRLVAAGQSNREIAAALVISPKTASVHVSNILAKLGAATRTEAAVKAHRLALLDLPGQRNS